MAQFSTLGGLTFVDTGGNPRGIRNPYYKAFMPRFGFAYQLNTRMVARGGYGLFYGLLGSENTDVLQPGFNQRTDVIASNDNGLTYVATLANPFPGGLQKPKGASGGLGTFLGRSPGFIISDGRRPYTQRWSLTIQYEPSPRNIIEIGYIGSRSVRDRITAEFNAFPRQYYSTSTERDEATIQRLTTQVTNPFLGIPGFVGSALYSAARTGRSQLLRPYPHFTSLTAGTPAGSSWYHGMTARYERRFSKGVQFQFNYTWSKTMEAASYLNDTDTAPEHIISNLDRPHRIVMNSIVELPFGKGRFVGRSAPGWMDQIIGGWQLQIVWQAQAGPPLSLGNLIYRGNLADLKLPGDQQTIDHWFNTASFERSSTKQLDWNIRTLSSRSTAVRGAGINVWDLSAMKNFRIREGIRLQLRCEAEGAMNHPNFDPPNMSPTSSLFGMVSTTQTNQEERRIFVGLKLIF